VFLVILVLTLAQLRLSKKFVYNEVAD